MSLLQKIISELKLRTTYNHAVKIDLQKDKEMKLEIHCTYFNVFDLRSSWMSEERI